MVASTRRSRRHFGARTERSRFFPRAREQTPRAAVINNVARLGSTYSISLIAISIAATGAGVGCGRAAEGGAEAAGLSTSFPVATPTVKDVTLVREYVADIRAVRRAEVRARFRGIVESVAVDEGRAVKAGQTLFTINARVRTQDLRVARAATSGARAELEAAELELHNTQLLADKQIVSDAELARARSQVQMMRAKVEQTQAAASRAAVELDYAKIKAPFAGVVDRVPHKAGSAIAEDELLTTITDTHEVFAYFAISEREYLAYLKSAPDARPRQVGLRLADGTMFAQTGTIDAVGGELDPETGTLTFRARFPNPDGVLKHGSSGSVVLQTELDDALLVPQKSTFDVQGDLYVYTLDAHDIAHARKIQVKARIDGAFVVASGLDHGERFVVEGAQQLRDGTTVHVEPSGTAEHTEDQPPGKQG